MLSKPSAPRAQLHGTVWSRRLTPPISHTDTLSAALSCTSGAASGGRLTCSRLRISGSLPSEELRRKTDEWFTSGPSPAARQSR